MPKDHFGGYYPEGSAPWYDIKEWAEYELGCMGLWPTMPRTKPKSWSRKIKGRRYNERWIRLYGSLRHMQSCFACCSDYANHAARSKRPIVRDYDLDRALLLAHAKILRDSKTIKRKDKDGQR